MATACRLHRVSLADNQLQQYAPDGPELGGINKRVDAHVEKSERYQYVVDAVDMFDGRVDVYHEMVGVVRQPCNHVEYTDEQHGLDDTGLHLTGMGLRSARSMGSHHARLATNDDQNAPVAENEDENQDDEERYEVPDAVG